MYLCSNRVLAYHLLLCTFCIAVTLAASQTSTGPVLACVLACVLVHFFQAMCTVYATCSHFLYRESFSTWTANNSCAMPSDSFQHNLINNDE